MLQTAVFVICFRSHSKMRNDHSYLCASVLSQIKVPKCSFGEMEDSHLILYVARNG